MDMNIYYCRESCVVGDDAFVNKLTRISTIVESEHCNRTRHCQKLTWISNIVEQLFIWIWIPLLMDDRNIYCCRACFFPRRGQIIYNPKVISTFVEWWSKWFWRRKFTRISTIVEWQSFPWQPESQWTRISTIVEWKLPHFRRSLTRIATDHVALFFDKRTCGNQKQSEMSCVRVADFPWDVHF